MKMVGKMLLFQQHFCCWWWFDYNKGDYDGNDYLDHSCNDDDDDDDDSDNDYDKEFDDDDDDVWCVLRTVSWVRYRDIHLLTHGVQSYTDDKRFSAYMDLDTNTWQLRIKNVSFRWPNSCQSMDAIARYMDLCV